MRRYERLGMADAKSAVLMDAPPDTNESVRPFADMSRYLRGIGLSAPRIISGDYSNGFLLLEDLGDDLFARVATRSPDLEPALYKSATDVLIALHRAKPPELKHFDPRMMAAQANLVFETWVQALNGPPDTKVADGFRSRFQDLLHNTTQGEPVIILRDYHAENLLWLAQRRGVARVGLLDFQDAMLAHPAYDLVSLLQDVRRDVPAALERDMIAYYIDRTGQDDHRFRAAYTVLGVQRNLRILAVFARLAGRAGKSSYATLIPRTWGHLMRGLDQPPLAPVGAVLKSLLPRPTRENLQRLILK